MCFFNVDFFIQTLFFFTNKMQARMKTLKTLDYKINYACNMPYFRHESTLFRVGSGVYRSFLSYFGTYIPSLTDRITDYYLFIFTMTPVWTRSWDIFVFSR